MTLDPTQKIARSLVRSLGQPLTAHLLGTSPSHLGAIERGSAEITPAERARVAFLRDNREIIYQASRRNDRSQSAFRKDLDYVLKWGGRNDTLPGGRARGVRGRLKGALDRLGFPVTGKGAPYVHRVR